MHADGETPKPPARKPAAKRKRAPARIPPKLVGWGRDLRLMWYTLQTSREYDRIVYDSVYDYLCEEGALPADDAEVRAMTAAEIGKAYRRAFGLLLTEAMETSAWKHWSY